MSNVRFLTEAMADQGKMSVAKIYPRVKIIWDREQKLRPKEWKAEVRNLLQSYCSASPGYQGYEDFFVHHERGNWSCKAPHFALLKHEDIEDQED